MEAKAEEIFLQHRNDHALYGAYQALADIFITSTYLLSTKGTMDLEIVGSIQNAVRLRYHLQIFLLVLWWFWNKTGSYGQFHVPVFFFLNLKQATFSLFLWINWQRLAQHIHLYFLIGRLSLYCFFLLCIEISMLL